MNNLVILGIVLVIIFLIMNGSKGKGSLKTLSKSVSKGVSGKGGLLLLVVGGFILYNCMNKNLVEGLGCNAPGVANKDGANVEFCKDGAAAPATTEDDCKPGGMLFDTCKHACIDKYPDIKLTICPPEKPAATAAPPAADAAAALAKPHAGPGPNASHDEKNDWCKSRGKIPNQCKLYDYCHNYADEGEVTTCRIAPHLENEGGQVR
jgi:hypothetical protein